MTIKTRSTFIYGIEINSENRYIDFKEGSTVYSAEVKQGRHTLKTLCDVLKRAFNDAGRGKYSCSVDRSTRKVTILSNVQFELLINGPHGPNNSLAVSGFTLNKGPAYSATSDVSIGKVFSPPRYLQNYLDPEHNLGANKESINESASGVIEIVSLGEKKACRFNIDYVRNEAPTDYLKNSLTKKDDLLDFMRYLIKKGPIDFLPDEENSESFYSLILEKTQASANGTAFEIYEILHDYFETKLLTFRVVTL